MKEMSCKATKHYSKQGVNMQKVIRDGKVAVLYSPGYGAGWYTWSVPI